MQALLDLIDARFDAQVQFLSSLVREPSDNPPGDCAPHAAMTAALLEGFGFRVERHAVPQTRVAAAGMRSVTNLVVRHRFGDGPVIALNAHGDVVPPGEGWSADPYGAEIREGALYGRGAAVSKSDFATYAFALMALIASGVRIGGTVELHLTYDEETGGLLGPAWLLQEGIVAPDYAICAGFSYAVTVAHNGCLHLEVTVTGKSAHAARPDSGHDALEAATDALQALYAHRRELQAIRSTTPGIDHPTLVVGLIEGGINTNVVPDRVTLRIDRRVVPEEDAARARERIEAVVRDAVRDRPGIGVEIREVLATVPMRTLPGADTLTHALQAAAREVIGIDIPAEGVPLYTDARLYCEAGVPTVIYGAGPRTLLEANGHRADEHVRLDDMRRATKTVALALVRLLSAA